MAIDDIQILDGSCPHSIDCDFEADTCMWWNSNYMTMPPDDIDWVRKTGRMVSQTTMPGPTVDHTLGTDAGFFILMEPLGFDHNAILASFPLEANVTYCTSFYTYVTEGAGTITLKYHNLDNQQEGGEFGEFGGNLLGWEKVRYRQGLSVCE